MLNSTVTHLQCTKRLKGGTLCKGSLKLFSSNPKAASTQVFEIKSGHLTCIQCKGVFPILSGVALLVNDVRFYLLNHVKGISKVVPDSEIPRAYLSDYLKVKKQIQSEHIEEDLEADRVIALYLMNHYLRVTDQPAEDGARDLWWLPRGGAGSPLLDSLVREYWDHGPFEQIQQWVAKLPETKPLKRAVELGCGVGGLYSVLKSHLGFYLGIDSSFASIALGRHVLLGVPYRGKIRIPEDLLQGPVSREIKLPLAKALDGAADLLVGDLEDPPLHRGHWDLTIALNTIDMLDEPVQLPKLQSELLKKGGTAIQSCPYIWHEKVAKKLRAKLPREICDSARAVEWLYERAGFKMKEKVDHLPWLFFKHVRQLEIYSVHLFMAEAGEL